MARALASSRVASAGAIDEKRTEIYYWWLLLALFFEYARPGAFVPGVDAAKLNSLIPLSLLVIVLVAPGLRPFGRIFDDRYSRWLTVYLGLTIVSIPFADVSLYSFNIFKKVLGYYFLFIVIVRLATSVRRLHGIFATLILSHLFLILMTPEVVLNPEVRTYIRGGTFLGDGNDFSLSLCLLLPMAVQIAMGARKRIVKLAGWGCLLLMVLAVVGTQSRGASLAMCGVFAFLWFHSKRKIASLAVILVVGVGVGLYASDAYFQRMGTIRHYEQDGSAEGRILAWKAGMRMAADHPLLGVGTGSFPTAYGARYMRKDLGNMPWLTAHSMYFLVLGEMGLPGVVTLCTLVFGGMFATMAIRRGLLAPATGPPSEEATEMARLLLLLTASAIALAIAGAFLSVAYYPHIFVLTGILVSARCIASRGSQSDARPLLRRPRIAPGVASQPEQKAARQGRGATGIGRTRPLRTRATEPT